MQMVLEKIRQLYPQLTKSQRRIADFTATSYKEAAFMTASRLAARLAVNEATVIRFAQRLGYPGYPELIDDIQTIVREELGATFESTVVAGTQEALLRALAGKAEALHRAASHISPQLAHEACKLLGDARRIYAIGQGISAPLAQTLSLLLRSLGLSAEAVAADPLSFAIMFEELDERCALVCILVAGDSPEMANALRHASEKGAHTLVLSWSPVSACAQAAEVAISYPTDEPGPLPSVGIAAAVIDSLVYSLASRDPESVRRRAKALEDLHELVLARRRC
jgi:DNA-binding MurR/RpiR family transcriptional regulator